MRAEPVSFHDETLDPATRGPSAAPRADRRRVLAGLVAAMGVAPTAALAQPAPEALADPTKEPGAPTGAGYGSPSPFAKAKRLIEGKNASPITSWSYTPLQDLLGNVTPSGLHYERHHGGIPTIDPTRHALIVHGMVKTAKKFTMADLRRLPTVSRRHFIECSGNTLSEWRKPTAKSVQLSHGLLSTSEWTGVAFSTLAREVDILGGAKWAVAEGADAAVMTRSIPVDKLLDDAILAYGQNGEEIRPEQGFPLRLLLPGYEGNMNIKWLRRIQIGDAPFMTREETSKYTDLKANGVADQFHFVMDAKSVITSPSGGMRLPGSGPVEVSGLAWSGRGRVKQVLVSFDDGSTWHEAALDSPPEPICTVRFRFPWTWDGSATRIQSRCIDETGYVQPTHAQLMSLWGANYIYHYNAIQTWQVHANGEVTNVASY